MSERWVYYLRPRGPLHLGTGRPDDLSEIDPLPRSDTLASALLSVWRHIDRDNDVSALAATPPFAVSSALPAVSMQQDVFAAPLLPVGYGLAEQISDRLGGSLPGLSDRKALRRVRYIDQEVLQSLLVQGEKVPVCLRSGCLLSASLADRLPASLWSESRRLRLQVDRLHDRASPGLLYEFAAVRFDPSVLLAVVIEYRDAAVRAKAEAALALLADEGIGADRTAGYGCLDLVGSTRFHTELGSGALLLLSLYHPTRHEVERGVLLPPARYRLVTRGGWVVSPGGTSLRKREVRLLEEGSILAGQADDVLGDSVRVLGRNGRTGPSHDVYRIGTAVSVPLSWPFE